MNTFSHVPPGFRFHPTDEELVDYYLRKKINSRSPELEVIRDVDLYKIEPWDLQDLCRLGTEEQNDWYFFSHKDKKYPTGSRTNRATLAGFWKATGRDKPIYSKHELVGMRKTLVFYKGRAPNGLKSDWIMHEYRLETDENATTTQEEGWVVCRVFKKRLPVMRRGSEHEPMWYDHDNQASFLHHEIDSPNNNLPSNLSNKRSFKYPPYNGISCKQELDQQQNYQITTGHCLQLPLLEAPKLHSTCNSSMSIYGIDIRANLDSSLLTQDPNFNDQGADWGVLDKFVESHELYNQGDVSIKGNDDQCCPNADEQFLVPDDASNFFYSSPIDLWK